MKRVILLIAIFLFMTGCKKEEKFDKVFIEYYDYFDTYITLTYYGDESRKDEIAKAIDEKLKYYHNLLTDYEKDGVVSKINHDRQGDNKEIVDLTKRVLKDEENVGYTLDLSKGKLFRLWKEAILSEKLPPQQEIEEARQSGGRGTVEIVDDKIVLKDGAQLDYGSVCKGYLNDELKSTLKELGVENYILNSGGNITVKGRPAVDRDKFKIGIQSPFDLNDYVETITATDISVVTSGDYQRFAMIDGVRYHHIIDLKTGYPANNQKRSITIVGPSAYTCDFLSTSLFLKEENEIKDVLAKYPGYYYYTVYEDMTFTCSDELRPMLGSSGN